MIAVNWVTYIWAVIHHHVVETHEAMPASRWIGFALMWTGLAVFAVESILHQWSSRQPTMSSTLRVPAGPRLTSTGEQIER